MSEQNSNVPADETGSDYQAPEIEEVVTPEGLEREVAYAGIQGSSQVAN
jgi:hypothetical protein